METEKIQLAKKFIEENKIQRTDDSIKDSMTHCYKNDLIQESFRNGKFLEDEELYSREELTEKRELQKNKDKRYYCKHNYKIHKFFGVGIRHILIYFALYKDHITLIHMGPPTGKELKKFKEPCP